MSLAYNISRRTTQKTQISHCCRGALIAPLPRNNRYLQSRRLATGKYLPSRCPEIVLVHPPISRSLHSNGPTRYSIISIFRPEQWANSRSRIASWFRVPPKRHDLFEPHGVETQKTVLIIVTSLGTRNSNTFWLFSPRAWQQTLLYGDMEDSKEHASPILAQTGLFPPTPGGWDSATPLIATWLLTPNLKTVEAVFLRSVSPHRQDYTTSQPRLPYSE
jgi:hypothetical protein